MKRMLSQFCMSSILISGLSLGFSCQKNSNQTPAFSAPGYWAGSFFSGATIAILNRSDGTSRVYLLTTLGVDTSSGGVKLDGTFSVQGNIFSANYIDSVGLTYINVQSERTSSNSIDGVFFLNSSTTASNTIETFNFELVKQ